MTTTAPAGQGTSIRIAHRAADIPPSATASLDAHAKDLSARGLDVINLTSGEPAFPTVGAAAEAGIAAITEDFTRYTAPAGLLELRAAVAARYAAAGAPYTAEDIVITAGAKQALNHAFTVLLNPGDEVLIPAPHWVSYPPMITLAGATPVAVQPAQGAGLKITPDRIEAACTPRTRLLILNNPSNPSGVVYTRAELTALARTAIGCGLTLIADEICEHWVYQDAQFTALASLGPETAARTVTVSGVSKTYAMTGWRIGWIAAPRPVARVIGAVQSHTASAPSSISQRAALGALKADLTGELAARRAGLDARRRITLDALAAIPGIDVAGDPCGAFFVFASVAGTYGLKAAGRPIRSAADFAQLLLTQANVAVVPGADFAAPHHVRVSYTVPADRLRTALARIAGFVAALR